MELTEEASYLMMRNLTELHMLTGKTFAPVETTELETMRGVMRVSFYRCKRCGAFIGQYTDICDYFRPRYCSNCGAKVVK